MLLNRSSHPILSPDKDWEKGGSLFAVAAIPDEKTGDLLLYYLVRFDDNPLGNVLCLARSQDARTWSKPDCGDDANIVMRASGNRCGWGEFMPVTVLKDPQEKNPAHRWKMVYWDCPDPSMPAGICLAVSSDGRDWKPLYQRPIITSMNDAMSMIDAAPNPCDPRPNATFFIYQQTWKYNPKLPTDRDNLKGMHRRISIWTSGGFGGGWTGPVTILEPDEQDAPDIQFYWLTPYRKPSGGYGGLLNCHHTGDQTMDVQLVSSPDGWTWSRENGRKPLLGLGERGRFDCGTVYAWAQPVKWRDKVLLFYNGKASVHDGKPRYPADPLPNPAGGIGLAEFSDDLLTIGNT